MEDTKAVVLRGQMVPIANVDQLTKLGELFARSGMFGCTNVEQGVVLALTCTMTGKNPVELKEEYHLINGNLTKRADAMLASLRDHGGEYEIMHRDSEKASIKIECRKAKGTFTLTWEDAQKETFVWSKNKDADGKLLPKDNWKGPRGQMQMLWARVVSDGVKTCCPEACKGTYTPGEMQDLADSPAPAQVHIPADEVEVLPPETNKKPVTPATEVQQEAHEAAGKGKDAAKKEADAAPVDYTRMPIGNKTGTHFKEIPIKQLEQIIALDSEQHPEVTEKHKKNAGVWLKKKAEAELKDKADAKGGE